MGGVIYSLVFPLFSYSFKDLRSEWSDDSRFLMGKNRVIQIALGSSGSQLQKDQKNDDDDENENNTNDGGAYRPGLDSIAEDLSGNVGLLFTNRNPKDVQQFFKEYTVSDYPRAGFIPNETITLPASRLSEEDFPHTQLQLLRGLGVPVRLDKGTIVVTENFNLCNKDSILTPEQGRLLKLFNHPIANFQITLISMWTAKNQKYQRLVEDTSNLFGIYGASSVTNSTNKKKTVSTMKKASKMIRKSKNTEEQDDDDNDENDEEMDDDDEDE